MFNVIVNFFSELEWVGGRFVRRGPEWAEISSAHYPQTHLPTLKEVMVDSPPPAVFFGTRGFGLKYLYPKVSNGFCFYYNQF